MSLVNGFGPLEENETTAGANSSLISVLFNIVAVSSLLDPKRNTNQLDHVA